MKGRNDREGKQRRALSPTLIHPPTHLPLYLTSFPPLYLPFNPHIFLPFFPSFLSIVFPSFLPFSPPSIYRISLLPSFLASFYLPPLLLPSFFPFLHYFFRSLPFSTIHVYLVIFLLLHFPFFPTLFIFISIIILNTIM